MQQRKLQEKVQAGRLALKKKAKEEFDKIALNYWKYKKTGTQSIEKLLEDEEE